MENTQEKKPITLELKCTVCNKLCGKIEFPDETLVDIEAVKKAHTTYCDDHVPLALKVKPSDL